MATARGMWESAKHPRGAHGKFGATGHSKTVTRVKPRRSRTSAVARAPRIVFETVGRNDGGSVAKSDKSRARTLFPAGRLSRRYDYR